MDSNNSRISMAKVGQRVRLNYGAYYGEAFGKVYGIVKDSMFGDQLRVKLDDFTFTTVSNFVSVGVGAYLLNGEG